MFYSDNILYDSARCSSMSEASIVWPFCWKASDAQRRTHRLAAMMADAMFKDKEDGKVEHEEEYAHAQNVPRMPESISP